MKEHQTEAESRVRVTSPTLAPGITFEVALVNLSDREMGNRTLILHGRYRGIVGYVHEIHGPRVVVRTGEPADWAAWDAR